MELLEGKGYEKPQSCGHLECAPYKLIQSQPELEIRSYAKATWVATSPIISASFKDAVVAKGFNILFAYIQGNNDQMLALNKSLKGTAWESSIPNKHSGDSLFYSAAGYNSPFEYENRVNEVMLWFD